MTDPKPEAQADSWSAIAAALAARYPGQRPSVLFCIWKLQQNPAATLRDFRDEAGMRDIPVAGRALHSARVLLGLEAAPAPTARKATPTPTAERPASPPRRGRPTASESLEGSLLAAVRRLQSDAGAEAERLRRAVRQAIEVLERALDD